MVPLLRSTAEDDVHRFDRGCFACKARDGVCIDLADIGSRFRRIVLQLFGEQLETRFCLGGRAIFQRHVVASRECIVVVVKLEGVRCLKRATRLINCHVALTEIGQARRRRKTLHFFCEDLLARFEIDEER